MQLYHVLFDAFTNCTDFLLRSNFDVSALPCPVAFVVGHLIQLGSHLVGITKATFNRLGCLVDLVSGNCFAHSGWGCSGDVWLVTVRFYTGYMETLSGAVSDFASGCGGKTLLLAGFSG